jgi:hypothetical protein
MIFTKKELMDLAKQSGVKGYSGVTKDDLEHKLFQPSIFPVELWIGILRHLSDLSLLSLSTCSFTFYSLCYPLLKIHKEKYMLKNKWRKPNQFCFIPEQIAIKNNIPYLGYVGDFFGLKCNSVPVPIDIVKKLGEEPIVPKKYLKKCGISFTFIQDEKNSYGICRLNPLLLIQNYSFNDIRYTSQVDRSQQLINEMIEYWMKL